MKFAQFSLLGALTSALVSPSNGKYLLVEIEEPKVGPTPEIAEAAKGNQRGKQPLCVLCLYIPLSWYIVIYCYNGFFQLANILGGNIGAIGGIFGALGGMGGNADVNPAIAAIGAIAQKRKYSFRKSYPVYVLQYKFHSFIN